MQRGLRKVSVIATDTARGALVRAVRYSEIDLRTLKRDEPELAVGGEKLYIDAGSGLFVTMWEIVPNRRTLREPFRRGSTYRNCVYSSDVYPSSPIGTSAGSTSSIRSPPSCSPSSAPSMPR